MFFNIKKLLTAFKPILFLQISKALPKKKNYYMKKYIKNKYKYFKKYKYKKIFKR